jgi:hypothetical protein
MVCKLWYVRLSHFYSDVICISSVVILQCLCNMILLERIVDDSGFPRTPDILLKLCGTHVQLSEVFETMTGACGP